MENNILKNIDLTLPENQGCQYARVVGMASECDFEKNKENIFICTNKHCNVILSTKNENGIDMEIKGQTPQGIYCP